MSAEEAPRERVWQRMPQGWIEFRAFGDRSPEQWLDWYLTTADGWLPDEARTAIVDGFHSGVTAFQDTAFDFAGVSITLGEHPAVTFLCTNVVRPASGLADPSVQFHRLFPLARFGTDGASETFTAPDGRVGTVSTGEIASSGTTAMMSVGEIRLPDSTGNVLIMGMCSDPAQRTELAVITAFALCTTQVLPEGVEPTFEADEPAMDVQVRGVA